LAFGYRLTMTKPESHSHTVPGGRGYWLTKRLWAAAEGLPRFRARIAEIAEFDRDCWFHGHAPTIHQMAEHHRRIQAADLAYPIIFSASGGLMDGGHRIAKAWLLGLTEIEAVRFEVDPEPDEVRPQPPLSAPKISTSSPSRTAAATSFAASPL